MSRQHWVRLDNASNIFLAARSEFDSKVFRMTAELDHVVDPELLQRALDATFDRYPLYHAVLRRGVFWYYLQGSDLRPRVVADVLPSCAPIYHPDRRTLLFRVIHHRRRISLELFHALSDGTGALWFLTDLVTAYTSLKFPEPDPGPAADDPEPVTAAQADAEIVRGEDLAAPTHDLTTDAFAQYFRRRRPHRAAADDEDFSREAAPAVLGVGAGEGPPPDGRTPRDRAREPRQRVYRVRGTRTPDHRPRVVELSMPAHQVLSLARAEGVALTMYLTAVFFESVRRSSGGLGRARTLAASVPVNLRQFFPSTSARNFFATIRVSYTYGRGEDDVGAVSRALEEQFRPKATPEALEEKLRRFIRLERLPVLRVVPRPLKDLILRAGNAVSNRGLSVAISNLGRVSLPEPAASHVGRMSFHVAAVRPQICAMSHDGQLTISFTSPFVETAHVREFARILSSQDVDVTVASGRVTEDELQEVGR